VIDDQDLRVRVREPGRRPANDGACRGQRRERRLVGILVQVGRGFQDHADVTARASAVGEGVDGPCVRQQVHLHPDAAPGTDDQIDDRRRTGVGLDDERDRIAAVLGHGRGAQAARRQHRPEGEHQ